MEGTTECAWHQGHARGGMTAGREMPMSLDPHAESGRALNVVERLWETRAVGADTGRMGDAHIIPDTAIPSM